MILHARIEIGTAVLMRAVAFALVALPLAVCAQPPRVVAVEESKLREYGGAYMWPEGSFVYLQLWSEFTGTNRLVAFDESGDARALHPSAPDRFFAGPGAGIATAVESHIEFQRDGAGRITGSCRSPSRERRTLRFSSACRGQVYRHPRLRLIRRGTK